LFKRFLAAFADAGYLTPGHIPDHGGNAFSYQRMIVYNQNGCHTGILKIQNSGDI